MPYLHDRIRRALKVDNNGESLEEMMENRIKVPVLIIGAGPTGLGTAIELGSRGVSCLIVERNDRVGCAPRAKTTHTRTRAHLRRWGVADRLARVAPFGIDYPSNVMFVTKLRGRLLKNFENAFNCAPERNPLYPEHAQWVPQYRLEEVMRAHVETLPAVQLRFNVNIESIVQNEDSVLCHGTDSSTGQRIVIEADYLVGADGSRSITRTAIGAQMEGQSGLSRNFNIIFRAPGLADAHPMGPAIMYWQLDTAAPSVIGPMDRDDLWYFMPIHVPDDLEMTDESAGALIRKATGVDIPFEILSSDVWHANRLIADKYHEGRVFLVGDACHLHPPYGGFGMNMGVSDGVDLGWKLAAVIQGWADPALLDSYELERRPVHHDVIEKSVSNASAHASIIRSGLEEDGLAGDALRAEVSEIIGKTREQEFRTLGVVLGYSYSGSPFVAEEAGPMPIASVFEYRPTAYPGHLAPHSWLVDGRSLYDLFGSAFTLLVFTDGHEADVEAAAAQAAAIGVPLEVVSLPDPPLAALYDAPLALIRPDQHVAWRGSAWPGPTILKRVTGKGVG